MKKILCLIDTLGIGGAERQMVGLAVLLKQKGYDVDLVAYHKDDFYAPIARKGGVEPVFLFVNDSQWSKLMAVRRFIRRNHGYDWVIAYKGGPNAIGCLLKLMGMRFKLIVSERITNSSIDNWKKRLFKLYRCANYIVPNAYSQGEFLSANFSWMKKKIVPISNFTDVEHFFPNFKQPENGLVVLTAARIAKQKNVMHYLEAISILKNEGVNNVRFEWYGDIQRGEENYAREAMEKVKELGLDDLIQFHPNVANIADHYRQCSFFCLPSTFEGFPNAVCEAMSCGKPIVCGRICDNARIVSEGENGLLFDPNDVNDIVRALKQMINMSKEQREQWGRTSRELAVNMLSEETFVDKYIKLIEQ